MRTLPRRNLPVLHHESIVFILCKLAHPTDASINLALCAAETSSHLWLNIPISVAVVAALAWAILCRDGGDARPSSSNWRSRRASGAGGDWKLPGGGPQKPDARWRDKVKAPLVEHAWETLCGSIIQEVSDTGSCAHRHVGKFFSNCGCSGWARQTLCGNTILQINEQKKFSMPGGAGQMQCGSIFPEASDMPGS